MIVQDEGYTHIPLYQLQYFLRSAKTLFKFPSKNSEYKVRFKFLRFHALSHGQDAQDLSNFKQFNVSAFIRYKFHSEKFYFKKLKISLSRVELPTTRNFITIVIYYNTKEILYKSV